MIEDQIALFFSYILLYIHHLNQLPWIRLVVWLESFCFRLLGFVVIQSMLPNVVATKSPHLAVRALRFS